jgi:AbrB family looped-hinge helix DNA binding protein
VDGGIIEGPRSEHIRMMILTLTARGQVTFPKDVLDHLGIKPGETIALDMLPGGRVALRAAARPGTIDGFLGLLAGKTKEVATLDEINEAAAAGWAGTL